MRGARGKFLTQFEDFITHYYGDRCNDHFTGACAICEMWAIYDLVATMIADHDDA